MKSKDTTLLEDLNQYLKGNEQALKNCKKFYKKILSPWRKDYCQTQINGSAENRKATKEILARLEVPEYQRTRYAGASITVYEFLKELQHTCKDKRLNNFLSMLERLEKKKRDKIIFFSLFAMLAIIGFSPVLIAHGANIMQMILAYSSFIPVVGLIYSVAVGFYSFYETTQNKKLSFSDKFRDNFFLLASMTLNIAAYGVLFTAAVTSTPIAGFLFVAASGVLVVKEMVRMVQLGHAIKQLGPISLADKLDVQQQKTRAECEHGRLARSIAIDLTAAVGMVGIIAAWCFIPGGGIFVPVVALASIGGVWALKSLAKFGNNELSRSRLLGKLEKIELANSERKHEASTSQILEGLSTGNASRLANVSQMLPEDQIGYQPLFATFGLPESIFTQTLSPAP